MEGWKAALLGALYVALFGTSVKAVVYYIVRPIQEAAKRIAAVAELSDKIDNIMRVTAEQSAHILTTEEAMIPLVRAIRSVGYAMKEHGWNGSTTHVLDNANEAEDRLRAASRESCEEAMRT